MEENFSQQEISRYIQDIYATDRGVRIVLYGDALFDGQSEYLNPKALSVLDRFSVVLKDEEKKVIVESHISGNLKLKKGMSAWTLSSLRATTVARYLTQRNELSPQVVVPISHGTNRPRFPKDLEGDRQKNTRLTFFLLPLDTEI